MSPLGDPFDRLIGDGSAPVDEPNVGWHSAGGRAAFWIVAGAGALVLCLAWFWYGLSFFEEMTEQCKSLAAGSSESGLGLLFGAPPLVLVYLLLLVSLLLIGTKYHSRPRRGALLALVVIAAASALGIAVNELLWTGDLFAMSAERAQCTVIDP